MRRSLHFLLFFILLLAALTFSAFPRSAAADTDEAMAMKFLLVGDIIRLLLCVTGTVYELLIYI